MNSTKLCFVCIVPTGSSSRITDLETNIREFNDDIPCLKGSKIFSIGKTQNGFKLIYHKINEFHSALLLNCSHVFEGKA